MLTRQIGYPILIGLILSPSLAFGETQWMGQINQWSVGFETGAGGAGEPYCRLLWDSQLGKTVEFRAGRDNTQWLVAKDGWAIPAGKTTSVTIVDDDRRVDAPAAFFDSKTLQLWIKDGQTKNGPTKRLVTEAFQGRPDLQLTFAGSEPDWIVPMSRVETLYPEFVHCMQRLKGGIPQTAQTAAIQPF